MNRWVFVSLLIATLAAAFAGLGPGADPVAGALFVIFLGVVTLVLIATLVAGDRRAR
jgi:hypothetical protein